MAHTYRYLVRIERIARHLYRIGNLFMLFSRRNFSFRSLGGNIIPTSYLGFLRNETVCLKVCFDSAPLRFFVDVASTFIPQLF